MREKVRFGIVGAGLWGEYHAEIYATHHRAELVAVCDGNEGRASEVARRYGARRVYREASELARDPEVDAVAVATPDFAHREPVLAAVQAGKHVLVEKPLATTAEDAEAIAEAVRRAGVRLMVDFHNRWNPPIIQAWRDVRAGTLGKVLSAYYRLNDTIMVPTRMLSWAAKSSILWFLGSHTVDTLRFLFDDEVARVYAVSRSEVLAARGIGVPDLYQAILEFRSGIVATIENHWVAPESNPMVNDTKVNILGTAGMINMDLTHHQMIQRYLADRADHPDCMVKPMLFDRHGGFAIESIRDFVEAVADGRAFRTGLEDGVNVTRTVLAIMESARKREPVAVAL
jgi:predicted dehydrogenase